METLDNNDDEIEGIFFNKPSLVLRIKSMMIDSVVLILLMYLATIILESLNVKSGSIRGIILVLVFLYEPTAVVFNRTIGQKIIGLRVRKFNKYTESDEKVNINIANSLVRFGFKLVLGWVSLLTIHTDTYGQAIHDKLGNSIMTIE